MLPLSLPGIPRYPSGHTMTSFARHSLQATQPLLFRFLFSETFSFLPFHQLDIQTVSSRFCDGHQPPTVPEAASGFLSIDRNVPLPSATGV